MITCHGVALKRGFPYTNTNLEKVCERQVKQLGKCLECSTTTTTALRIASLYSDNHLRSNTITELIQSPQRRKPSVISTYNVHRSVIDAAHHPTYRSSPQSQPFKESWARSMSNTLTSWKEARHSIDNPADTVCMAIICTTLKMVKDILEQRPIHPLFQPQPTRMSEV